MARSDDSRSRSRGRFRRDRSRSPEQRQRRSRSRSAKRRSPSPEQRRSRSPEQRRSRSPEQLRKPEERAKSRSKSPEEQRKMPGPRGAVVIGNPNEHEPPEYTVEEVGKRNSGDKTYQAVLNIKGQNDRVRNIRAPPRTGEGDASNDGEEMKKAFMKNGLQGVRDWQSQRRKGGSF